MPALPAAVAPARRAQQPRVPVAVTFVVSGGRWRDGGRHGHYRLVVLAREAGSTAPRLVIEWIEERPGGAVVRETRDVQVLGAPWVLAAPQLSTTGGRVTASVTGSDPAGAAQAHWTLTLGPPGQFAISPLR